MPHLARRLLSHTVTLALVLALSACGGNGGGSNPPPDTYTIGGTLSGLGNGLSVTLLNNGGNSLAVNGNGPFTFSTALASGATYAVTVGTQPSGQACTVTNGSGTVGAANVVNVAVTCAYTNVFIWKDGSNLVAPAGVYGSLGVPSPTNAPGGRNWSASWKDSSGNFWAFGGQGYVMVQPSESVIQGGAQATQSSGGGGMLGGLLGQ